MNREDKKNALKAQIIKSIFNLMKMKSFEEITVNEICREADMSKRTLYSYFHSKEEMYLEIVQVSFEELNKAMNNQLKLLATSEKKVPVKDEIIAIGTAYLNFCINDKIKGMLVNSFEESNYSETYKSKVSEISQVANEYELYSYFSGDKKNHQWMTPQLALMLWSNVLGLTHLLINKEEWLKQYYKKTSEEIIEDTMAQLGDYIDYLISGKYE